MKKVMLEKVCTKIELSCFYGLLSQKSEISHHLYDTSEEIKKAKIFYNNLVITNNK